MTERERFITALERKPLEGLVPTFELVFFLTMEKFGKVHPSDRTYHRWSQMTEKERRLHRNDIADTYIGYAREYGHSAVMIAHYPGGFDNIDEVMKIAGLIKEKTNNGLFVMLHGDPTFAIPTGNNMMDFSIRMLEDSEGLKNEAEDKISVYLKRAETIAQYPGTIDGFALCSDYCFNTNSFFNPELFGEYVTPYLERILKEYRSMGFYTIKHTDGNIMSIIDQIVDCRPDALHSLDPQGGVSLSEVKKLYGNRVCLIGNVNCGLLQSGTEKEVEEDVIRSLKSGMPGYGYIFSTSNCIYTGLSLERYELMNNLWRKHGIY